MYLPVTVSFVDFFYSHGRRHLICEDGFRFRLLHSQQAYQAGDIIVFVSHHHLHLFDSRDCSGMDVALHITLSGLHGRLTISSGIDLCLLGGVSAAVIAVVDVEFGLPKVFEEMQVHNVP